ncbi:MAG: M56 family metallopeptidase, partial [Phycisphaerales bacterium]
MGVILEQVNRAGAAFVRFAGPMLVQSAVLILILLLVDVFLRKRVRAVFRYWIWVLVLLKLVLPTSLSSPFSVGSFFGERLARVEMSRPGAEATRESGRAVESGAATLPFLDTSEIRDYGYVPARAAASEVEPILTEAAVSPETGTVRLSWQALVFSLWLVVVVAMGLLLVQRAVFVRGLVRQARDADVGMKDALERCRVAMGVKRRVGLKVSVNATSPAVCGLLRPVILMPHNLGRGLGAGQLRPVFFHELAHIRRGDLWVNLAQTVLQVVYFYNPLLWVANSMIRRVREEAVDEAVLVAMGERAGQYPEALVRVARLAFERPALSLRLIGVVESKSALSGRIKHILGRPIPKSAKLGILGLLVILMAAAILLPMVKSGGEGDKSDWTKPTERWKARAVKKTSLESSFGGWRNLPFEVSAAEEEAVKQCRKLLVYWPRSANDGTSKKLLGDIRGELESMVWEMPEFFYG